mmetsp:Transcript_153983/g.279757  ORF Transcript_153983/g.279757 Transcript_153983/m.279757 type:complete len:84 (+) Transcript_153983:351-602(+)
MNMGRKEKELSALPDHSLHNMWATQGWRWLHQCSLLPGFKASNADTLVMIEAAAQIVTPCSDVCVGVVRLQSKSTKKLPEQEN